MALADEVANPLLQPLPPAYFKVLQDITIPHDAAFAPGFEDATFLVDGQQGSGAYPSKGSWCLLTYFNPAADTVIPAGTVLPITQALYAELAHPQQAPQTTVKVNLASGGVIEFLDCFRLVGKTSDQTDSQFLQDLSASYTQAMGGRLELVFSPQAANETAK